MEVFSMVVWIVAIAVFGGVANNFIKAKNKRDLQEPQESGLDEELAALQERVETLERIVTDEKFQLAEKINRLEETA